MNIPKLSIIIPIFGAEKYIDKCLNSLINQTYGIENLEIICINDCTKDKSMDVVKKYKQKYPNNIIIQNHKINKGPGGARNTGLKLVTGEYITFVDPDDYLELKAYNYLIPKMQQNNISLSCFDFIFFNEKEHFTKPKHPSSPLFKKEQLISKSELLKNNAEIIHSMSVWNKIYSRELLSNIEPFLENQLFNEDAKFSLECFLNSSKIFFVNKKFYNYRKETTSNAATNKTYITKSRYNYHLMHHNYLETIKSKYPSLRNEINIFHLNNWYQFMHNILLENIITFSKEDKIYFYKATRNIYSKINIYSYKNKTHILQRLLPLSFKYSFSLNSTKFLYFILYKSSKTLHGI